MPWLAPWPPASGGAELEGEEQRYAHLLDLGGEHDACDRGEARHPGAVTELERTVGKEAAVERSSCAKEQCVRGSPAEERRGEGTITLCYAEPG